jgi:hypothetical protein
MILGYEWLEQFKPMKIHWGAKWIAIPCEDTTQVIQGMLSEVPAGQVVQVFQLSEEDHNLDGREKHAVQQQVPVEIQHLLDTYALLFATYVSFPPPRPYCYSIPWIPGSKPVQIKPYRYTPHLKDEIEK